MTAQAGALTDEVGQWVTAANEVLAGPEPAINIGSHCSDPYDCPFMAYCKPKDGTAFPVSLLPRSGKLAAELMAEGYRDIRDIPAGRLQKDDHQRIWRVSRSGVSELDAQAAAIIQAWGYPRHYLDFETIAFAVPIWLGTRPYEQLPFQWSCHIETGPGIVVHRAFLADGAGPPMRQCAEQLVAAIGPHGPVVAYNAGFEKGVLERLAARFEDLRPALTSIIARLVDLLPVARKYYYAPQMMGSWSIKKLLPALVPELRYEDLPEVREGQGAQIAYLELLDPHTPAARRAVLRNALERYCELDTLAMVRIAERISRTDANC